MSLASFEAAITEHPGSTRGIALLRIGLAAVAWAELGELMTVQTAGAPLVILFYGATLFMLVGFRAQIATFASAVALWAVIQRVPNAMHHHTYLEAMATTCLALTPCGKSFSVDRFLSVRNARKTGAPTPEETGNLWALRLICLQLSALFFWGGYSKLTLGTQSLQTGFLSGDRLEQTVIYHYSLPQPNPGWVAYVLPALGAGVTLFEVFASIGLWIPRVRIYVLLGCLAMTSSFQLLLSVGTFGFLAAVLYLSFVPPATVHRIIDRLLGGTARTFALMRIGVAVVSLVEVGEAVHPRKPHALLALPFYLSVFAMALGVRARAASIATAGSIVLVAIVVPELLPRDVYALAAACVLLALTPCGDSLSIDRWRGRNAKRSASPRLLAGAFTLLLAWNGYQEIALGKAPAVVAGAVMLAGAAAAWLPKVRAVAIAAALAAMTLAYFYAALPALDLLLAMVLALAHASPERVEAAMDDLAPRSGYDGGPA